MGTKHPIRIRQARRWQLKIKGGLRHPEVLKVAQKFAAHLETVRMSLDLHPWLVGQIQLYQDAATRVAIIDRLTGKDAQNKIHAIADKAHAEYAESANKGFERDEGAFKAIDFMLGWFGRSKSFGDRADLLLGFDAVFQGVLILAWTSIEVCLEELFAVVQKGSRLAATLSGNELRIARIWFSNRKMPIPPKFKARTKQGDERFRTLRAVREAYSRAIHGGSSGIDAALASTKLDALALLRNLYAHKAGVVDRMFHDESSGVIGLSKIRRNVDSKVWLNGEQVKTFINRALHQVGKLLSCSDKWLRRHP